MDGAILFDFGGTLDAEGLTWNERFYRLFRDAGVAPSREGFDPLFYRADDALVGAIPATLSFRDTVFRLAADVSRALGLDDDPLTARVAGRFLDDALARLAANRPMLERLGRRYRLGIVSNFYGNLPTVCENAGVRRLFTVIVDSTQVGCEKPDPRIFQRAVAELELTAAAATVVGDSLPRDMAGARAAGMRHIWLAGEAADGAQACCPGDPVVRSLRAVEALLL